MTKDAGGAILRRDIWSNKPYAQVTVCPYIRRAQTAVSARHKDTSELLNQQAVTMRALLAIALLGMVAFAAAQVRQT
jgi:hypothetical protein